MQEGWLCPRCGRINAPFVNYCECKEDTNRGAILKDINENELLRKAINTTKGNFNKGDQIFPRDAANALWELSKNAKSNMGVVEK